MEATHDAHHVRIDHHTTTSAALAAAQRALLERRSTDTALVATRAWKRRGVLVLGFVVAVGLLLLLVAAPSMGRARAYENCVADAEERAARIGALQLDRELHEQSAAVEELCAGYRTG